MKNTTDLTFNQWQAYLLINSDQKKKFDLYCKGCNFTKDDIDVIMDLYQKNKKTL